MPQRNLITGVEDDLFSAAIQRLIGQRAENLFLHF
jgi:hypothetical protein